MKLVDFFKLIRRSVAVVVIGLFIGIGAAIAVFYLTPKSVTVEADYLFMSAPYDAEGKAINPFLNIGNGIEALIDVVSLSMTDGQTVRSFEGSDPNLEYQVFRDLTLSAPLMKITVTSATSDKAFEALDRLALESVNRSQSIQLESGAPREGLVRANPISRSIEGSVDYMGGIRNGFVVLLGVAMLVFLIVVVRERRRDAKQSKGIGGKPVDADNYSKK